MIFMHSLLQGAGKQRPFFLFLFGCTINRVKLVEKGVILAVNCYITSRKVLNSTFDLYPVTRIW